MKKVYQKGFTVPELLIVMTIFGLLIGLVTINLGSIQRRADVNATISTLLADIKQQQIKTMMGDTEGRSTSDMFGVHFQTDKYILFHGNTYNPSDTANLSIPLTNGVSFTSILLPNQNIIFTQISGEVYQYSTPQHSITLTSTGNETKTIQFNKYGVITQMQ